MPTVASRHRQIIFPETLYFFLFSTIRNLAAPALGRSMQSSCKAPANLLLALVPMAHPLNFTLNFSLTNLQTQPREINYAKPGLQLWSRTVPRPLNTTIINQVALLWHRKNMISIQCKVLGGCIFSSVCSVRLKQSMSFFPGWCLPASQGQSHLSFWFS